MNKQHQKAVQELRKAVSADWNGESALLVPTNTADLAEAVIRELEQALRIAKAEFDRATHFEKDWIAAESKLEQAQRERDDLERRWNNQKSFLESFARCLDGLPLDGISGSLIDSARDAGSIRCIVEHLIKERDDLRAKLLALEQEEARRIRALNRLGTWAQQDPTQPIPFGVQRWVLDQLEEALGSHNLPSTTWKPTTENIKELEAKLLASEAAGAEMRELLLNYWPKDPEVWFHDARFLEYKRKLEHATSSAHGTTFLAERERHVKALREIACCPRCGSVRCQGHLEPTNVRCIARTAFNPP